MSDNIQRRQDLETRELIRATVRETLLQCGMDVSSPQALMSLQKDMAHLRMWREAIETGQRIATRTIITTAIIAALGLLWLGLQDKIKILLGK